MLKAASSCVSMVWSDLIDSDNKTVIKCCQILIGAQNNVTSSTSNQWDKKYKNLLVIITTAPSEGGLMLNMHNHDTAVSTSRLPAYRVISSLHSSGALGLLGTDRKRVVLSVEGWSRLRTQHSSPDLDHWPACTQRDSETLAICRKPGGNDVMLRRNIWPLLKVTLSCRSRSRLTKTLWGAEFNPTVRWSMGAWERSEHTTKSF